MLHLYFHNDIDGILSAALYLARSRMIVKNDYILKSVQSVQRGNEFKKEINQINKDDKVFIFDYQYHPRADLWIDHHPNEMMGYDKIINDHICYDHRSESAAALVKQYCDFMKFPNVDRAEFDLVTMANMIDSANYPSAEFIFKGGHHADRKEPYMILRAYLEYSYPVDMMYCRITEVLAKCELDIYQALKVLNIGDSYIDEIYRRAMKIKDRIEIYHKMSVIRQRTPYQHPRYAENFVSKAKYNVRIMDASATQNKVSIGFNKWYGEPNNIDLGRYVAKHPLSIAGGGHFNVAGCVVDKTKVDEFLNQFSILVEGDTMEKYAVDKENDQIEKEAQEMVKTGAVKNLDEARKKAVANQGDTPEQKQLQP